MINNPNNLIELVINSNSWDELPSLIDDLVKLKEQAVLALLEQPPGLVTSPMAYVKDQVFARVGYPANKPALDYLVGSASNPNSLSWEVTREAVLKIGKPVLPSINEAITYYKNQDFDNRLEIETLEDIKNSILDMSM